MEKKYIHIYQCKQGDILAEDILDAYGTIIVSKDVVINEHVIKKLNSSRIRQLAVYEKTNPENEDKIGLSSAEFKKCYREDICAMKRMLEDIVAGRKLDYEKVKSISDSVYSKRHNIANIIECTTEIKNVEEYIYTHSINVAMYALLIAKWLDLSEEETRNIVTIGILHDIGKSGISEDILNKKGSLLPEEFEEIKHHTEIGYEILKDIPQLSDEIREGVLMHHEREDGKGYPAGIKGDKINLYAKIISVADVYDALTSERVYKKRITPFDTFSELVRIGYGYFDTKVLMTVLSNISCYYNGTYVKMNTGETGKIIFVAPQSISTPIVAVNGKLIDLSRNRQLKIVDMI